VGNQPCLGKWNPDKGIDMTWTEGDVWVATAQFDSGSDVQYKCVVCRDGGEEVQWEDGENHSLVVDGDVEVEISWGSAGGARMVEKNGAGAVGGDVSMAAGGDDNGEIEQSDAVSVVVEKLESERWSGKEVTFMQQNAHPTSRDGAWNSENLRGVSLKYVSGDKEAGR